jgi:hypothetical protein
LYAANTALDGWRAAWTTRLAKKFPDYPFCTLSLNLSFLRMFLNTAAYKIWRARRTETRKMGQEPAPNERQIQHFVQAIRAAEETLFSLSVQSRTDDGFREVYWDGIYPPQADGPTMLTPDQMVVDRFSVGPDTLLCVVIPFAAMFLW